MSDIHRPDRIGALVLALIAFSLYVYLANILTSLALASLPLGTVGSVWAGSTAIATLTLFDVVILNLYLIANESVPRQTPVLSRNEGQSLAVLFSWSSQ